MKFLKLHWQTILVILMMPTAIIGTIAGVEKLKQDEYKYRACANIVNIGLGTKSSKFHKFHMETCMAGLRQVELDFDQAEQPEIARSFFMCLAIGENQDDFDWCHEFKSRRLFQERYRISREEAEETEE